MKQIVLTTSMVCVALVSSTAADWPQWGGPTRNFVVDTKGVASSWPSGGPKQLWSRALGEGHSSIVSDGRVLYTLYRPIGLPGIVRRSQEEVVIALDAATGKTLWEHTYPATTQGVDFEYGAGPHGTPVIAGDLLIATGSNKQVIALDRRTGRVAWEHDLQKEFNAPGPGRGYSCSPLLYRDTVIVTGGGRGSSVIAFRVKDGSVAWKNGEFPSAPASPMLITVGGDDQLVVTGGDEIIGMSPVGGARLWSHPHKTEWGLNISTPVFGPANQLFVSAAYNNGSRLLELSKTGTTTTVRELWFQNRMRVHFGTVIRIADRYYGSSGDFGPAFMAAIDAKDGRVAWQNRGFARSSFLLADGKLVILDEDGTLAIATVGPDGLQVHAKTQLMSAQAWTVPTLVGTTLYARDRKNIVAVALGN